MKVPLLGQKLLTITLGDKVGAIQLRECSPKIITLKSIKNADFLASLLGKRLLLEEEINLTKKR